LPAAAELPILKTTQKYRILQMIEQAAENSLQEGHGFSHAHNRPSLTFNSLLSAVTLSPVKIRSATAT
jgi:hypothetical protein